LLDSRPYVTASLLWEKRDVSEICVALVTVRDKGEEEKSFTSLYVSRPPLWSSGQSYWLQIHRSLVRFPGTKRKKKVVSETEELLRGNSSGSGLESREYGRRDSSR
jgi:hypothetical protein